MSEPLCATCGHPRDNHPYRHPFAGPSKDDTIKELEAKLEKTVEGLHTISGHVVLNNENEEELSESALLARALLAEIEGTDAP
jgi:hypothetical protein